MRSMLLGTVAALTIAVLGSCPAAAQSETVQLLSVQSGHSVLLQTPGLSRVAVGDGRIAGVVPIGSSQLVINGKAPGHTTVFIWEAGRRATYEVTVTEQEVDQIAQMLRTSIDEPRVQVVSFNHSVVVRGVVADGAHFQMLTDILGRFEKFATTEKYTIVNAVTVAHPLGDIQHDLSSIPGATGIRVDPDGKGNVIVSGHVHDAQTVAAILERARGLAGPYLASDGKLIDRVSTDTNTMIDIKIYVLEVDQTAASNLGVQLQSASNSTATTVIGATTTTATTTNFGAPIFPIQENGPTGLGAPFRIGAFFRTIMLAPTLNLMLSEGHAHLLSAPDLVTTPGMAATFLVGGQIPIPFSTGLGQVSIQYKDFGVQLNVTPTLLGNGAVQALIAPDISDLDFADGVNQNGFTIPALKESKLSTNVITQPGESVIMGGMVRRVETRNIQKIPLLGDLPILGKLFRSTSYQNNQSDVVFIMTPVVITR